MSFLEHECSVSLAAALAFLDESLDAADGPQLTPRTLGSSAAVLPSPRASIPDPELLLEALDEDDETIVPLSQIAPTDATLPQLQLESSTLPVQKTTTIVPAASSSSSKSKSKKQPKTSRATKKKKLNYDPNKARNERRFELACLRKEVKDLELTLEQLQSMQGNEEGSKSVKRPRQLVPRTSGAAACRPCGSRSVPTSWSGG